jgi:hypothetical protein
MPPLLKRARIPEPAWSREAMLGDGLATGRPGGVRRDAMPKLSESRAARKVAACSRVRTW